MIIGVIHILVRANLMHTAFASPSGFMSAYGLIVRGDIQITAAAESKLLDTTLDSFKLNPRYTEHRFFRLTGGSMTLDEAFSGLHTQSLSRSETYEDCAHTLDIVGNMVDQLDLLLFYIDGGSFKYFQVSNFASYGNQIAEAQVPKIIQAIPAEYKELALSPCIHRQNNEDQKVTIWMRKHS